MIVPGPWRWVGRILVGTVLTALLLATLGPLALALDRGMSLLEPPEARAAALSLIGVGVILGAVVAARMVHPVVPGVMAVLLAVVYAPPVVAYRFPTWPFGWVQSTWIRTHTDALPYFLVGLLAGVSLLRALESRGTARADRHQEDP